MAEFMEQLATLGIEGASASAAALSGKAEDYNNQPVLEQAWAIKAAKYAETHMKLIQSIDAAQLRLTRNDDAIYSEFMKHFADMKIDVVNVDDLKSDAAKSIWRPVCNHFDGMVKDFNFGTLLRLDASKDYTEENTILEPIWGQLWNAIASFKCVSFYTTEKDSPYLQGYLIQN